MKKRYIFFTIFLLMFFIGISNTKSLASFYIKDFEINSQVLNNGDMKVQENITYYSNEKKNGVTRQINLRNNNNTKNSAEGFSLLNVKVNGINAKQVMQGNLGDEGVYEYTVSGKTYNLKVYVPFRGIQTKTVTYEYILKNVGVRYNDTSEIYWNFIGDEWDTKISNLKINIQLPENSIKGTTYVFGHGSDTGTFTKQGNKISLFVQNLPAYQPVDARILFSENSLNNSTKTVNDSVLEKYINQEEGLSVKKEEPVTFFGLTIAQISIILSVVIVLFGIIVYFKYDKEISVPKHYYFRDIPANLEPELLQRVYFGKKTNDSFWIAFLNLVKMGVYNIQETTNAVGKKIKLIIYQGKEGKNLKEYQHFLIDTINGFFDKDESAIDIQTLNAKMKRSTGSGYKKFVDKLETQYESYFGDFSTKVSKKPFLIAVILMIVLILFISAITFMIEPEMGMIISIFLGMTTTIYTIMFNSLPITLYTILFFAMHFSAFQMGIIAMMTGAKIGLLYIPYIILFIILQYTQRVRKSTKEERIIREQIKGLRRYIKNYSKIGERTLDSIVIWEDYLIIAIALKLNKKTINYFYDYCSQNLDNQFSNSLNTFGTYYYMNITFRSMFNNYRISYVRTTSSSSSGGSGYSGSSGGFSGGSSSGGRGRRRRGRKLFLKGRLGPGPSLPFMAKLDQVPLCLYKIGTDPWLQPRVLFR